jgi:hypothetical protein
MGRPAIEHGKEVHDRPQVCGKSAEDARKILFRPNDAGMSMKTNDRCGKSGNDAGMLLIINQLSF